MKIQLTFKTPDVVDRALSEYCVRPPYNDVSEEDAERLETEYKTAKRVIEKFVDYGEYVTIEIDTEAQTARVL
jgi:radical SAM superfamily enzyme with C-terminal helix-hairpin-helix motif